RTPAGRHPAPHRSPARPDSHPSISSTSWSKRRPPVYIDPDGGYRGTPAEWQGILLLRSAARSEMTVCPRYADHGTGAGGDSALEGRAVPTATAKDLADDAPGRRNVTRCPRDLQSETLRKPRRPIFCYQRRGMASTIA